MTVTLKMISDINAVLKDHDKLAARQAKVIAGLKDQVSGAKRAKRAYKETGREGAAAFGSIKSSALGFLSALGVQGGIQGALNNIISLVNKWDEDQKKVSRQTMSTARAAMAFTLLQEKGVKGQRFRQVAALGARQGLRPESGEAFEIVQALQSMRGMDFNKAMKEAPSLFAAVQAQMPFQDILDVAMASAQKGQAPSMGVRGAFIAGQSSAKDPATFAKLGRAMSVWEDLNLMFAAGIPTLASTSPNEFQTFLLNAGLSLDETTGKKGALFKKLRVTGKSQEEKLIALRRAKMLEPAQYRAAGFEKTEARGLSAIVKALPEVLKKSKEFKAINRPGYLYKEVKSTLSRVPELGLTEEILSTRARTAVKRSTGPIAVKTGIEALESARYREAAGDEGLGFLAPGEGPLDVKALVLARMRYRGIAKEMNIRRFKEYRQGNLPMDITQRADLLERLGGVSTQPSRPSDMERGAALNLAGTGGVGFGTSLARGQELKSSSEINRLLLLLLQETAKVAENTKPQGKGGTARIPGRETGEE